MAGNTRNKGKVGRPRKQQAKKEPERDVSFFRAEFILILSFAVSVLLFLSNFHLCGIAGDFLRSVQLGLFGLPGFIAPLLMFTGICFYMSNTGSRRAVIKIITALIIFLTVSSLLHLMFGPAYLDGQKLSEIYQASSINGRGGGITGGFIGNLLRSFIGTVGAYLVLIVLMILSIVFITEKSFVSLVQRGSGKAYQYAREDMSRRKAIHAEKLEEQKRLREENKVRGVDIEATRISKPVVRKTPLETPVPKPDPIPEPILEEPVIAPEPSAEPDDYAIFENFTEQQTVSVPEPVINRTDPVKTSEPSFIDQNPAGSFTEFAPSYQNDEDDFIADDSVPFDTGEQIATSDLDTITLLKAESTDVPEKEELDYLDEDLDEDSFNFNIKDDFTEDAPYSFDSFADGFSTPAQEKQIVTANGKIIEADTEALSKKLESQRKSKMEEPDPVVEVEVPVKKKYVFPPLSLLTRGAPSTNSVSDKTYRETAVKLQQTLKNFGVGVTVTNISCGPSVTRYELHPEQGVKVSKIVGLADDIKLSLAAADIRIEAPIPGKSAVGIEVPNKENNTVWLRDILESEAFQKNDSHLAFAVGKDIGGQVVTANIAKMPHLLIAGATGSGKSVCINTLIMSILYKSEPDDVKLIMIDPKVVELSVYNGIPHLLIPVVTEPKKASGALNWAVAEMEDRYKKFAKYNVRDLKGYNAKIAGIQDIEDENKPVKMPQIVIIIDELADLMMVAPGEVEDAICRLAQLARAAGIHLVIATQRPSVNVITGLIKANVPSRIAFAVSSGVDSRTIIDMNGAEKLLGKGDMLFYPSGYPKPQRVQGAFISDSEVSKVVDFLTEQGMASDYNPEIEKQIAAPSGAVAESASNNRDEYFDQAARFIIEKEKASIGMLQRAFKIGFNRAARIMDQLAEAGVVGEEEGTKPRKVLMTIEEFENSSF